MKGRAPFGEPREGWGGVLQGEIPYIKVGTHRRVRFEDLIKYKQQRDIKRREGLKELTQFLQDEGFYDEESNELNQ